MTSPLGPSPVAPLRVPASGNAARRLNSARDSASKNTPSAASADSVIRPAPRDGDAEVGPNPLLNSASTGGATDPSFDTEVCLDWLYAGAAVAINAKAATTQPNANENCFIWYQLSHSADWPFASVKRRETQ